MNPLKISEGLENGVRIVGPQGRLDPIGGPVLEKHCLDRVKSGDLRLLLDFSGVEYVSSAGLRGILVIAKAVGAAGGKMVLCGVNSMVGTVFEHSGFSLFLKIEADRTAGLQAAAGA